MLETLGAIHISELDRSEIYLSSLWESVHTYLDRSWIERERDAGTSVRICHTNS